MNSIFNPASNLVQRNICLCLSTFQKTTHAKPGTQTSYSIVKGLRNISIIARRERKTYFAFNAFDNEKTAQNARLIAKHYTTNAKSTQNIDVQVKSAKAALKKIKRKNTGSQKLKSNITPGKDAWSIVGYTTAESYDLYNLAKNLAIQVILKLGWVHISNLHILLHTWGHSNNKRGNSNSGM